MVEHERKELTQQDFEELVAQAVKAPSGHNTQPWYFELSGNTIEIKPDFSRSLPVVDADNRELFISLGCATENLCIAASHKGYDATVAVNETAAVVTIELTNRGATANPLFTQIAKRQTNRSQYDERKISETEIVAL